MEPFGGLNVSPVAFMFFALLAAGLDVTALVALIAGISGAITGIGAVVVQRRDVRTKADTSYVDMNLRAMQALVDNTVANEARLQEENRKLREDLTACEKRCDECLRRINRLERPN